MSFVDSPFCCWSAAEHFSIGRKQSSSCSTTPPSGIAFGHCQHGYGASSCSYFTFLINSLLRCCLRLVVGGGYQQCWLAAEFVWPQRLGELALLITSRLAVQVTADLSRPLSMSSSIVVWGLVSGLIGRCRVGHQQQQQPREIGLAHRQVGAQLSSFPVVTSLANSL